MRRANPELDLMNGWRSNLDNLDSKCYREAEAWGWGPHSIVTFISRTSTTLPQYHRKKKKERKKENIKQKQYCNKFLAILKKNF